VAEELVSPFCPVCSILGSNPRPLTLSEPRVSGLGFTYEEGLFGTTGFTALDYNGKPVIMDEKCTSGAFIMVNENYVEDPRIDPVTVESKAPLTDIVLPINSCANPPLSGKSGEVILTHFSQYRGRTGVVNAITAIIPHPRHF